MTTPPDGFESLWKLYPWPESPPVPEAPMVGRDSPGFELLYDTIKTMGDDPVIMEIGAEFGGSTRKFLEHTPAWVVSVDPWPDSYGGGSFPHLRPFLGKPGGMYDLFLTFCWDLRSRLATVREGSPGGPLLVRDSGVEVDLIYVDGDHRYDAVMRDLTIADALFPSAVLCGDDWLMTKPADGTKYEHMVVPVQLAVKSWAAFHDFHLELADTTWVIDKSRPYNLEPPEIRYLGSETIERRLTQIQRALTRIERSANKPDLPTRVYRKLRPSGPK